jgi:hypothetical protein
MFKVPNQYRVREAPWKSDDTDGNNGVFIIPNRMPPSLIFIIASDGMGWEHVSVSLKPKDNSTEIPPWIIMNVVKDIFWGEEDAVFQFHPPKSIYRNFHPGCLHLWRPVGKEIPLPLPEMVGPERKLN